MAMFLFLMNLEAVSHGVTLLMSPNSRTLAISSPLLFINIIMISFLKRKHFLSFVFASIRAKWYRTKVVVAATIAGRFCKDRND